MPEGPSIVLQARRLQVFAGQTVVKSGGYDNPVAKKITGKSLQAVSRYAKYIILQFNQFFITVHLRLFGSFLINEQKDVNASFYLEFPNDQVNFYVVKVKEWEGMPADHFPAQLDPFSKQFLPEIVAQSLFTDHKSKRIGVVLMNQKIFPGVGNVIRNEVLFLAGVHPESVVEHIPKEKIFTIVEKVQEFSLASVALIQNGNWKQSSAVYQKKEVNGVPVRSYKQSKINRKTFVAEKLQKLYT